MSLLKTILTAISEFFIFAGSLATAFSLVQLLIEGKAHFQQGGGKIDGYIIGIGFGILVAVVGKAVAELALPNFS